MDMSEEDRKALRQHYIREYMTKTGRKLTCIESKIRPNRCKVACRMNILQIASAYTGIPVEQIVSKSRRADLVDIRRMITGVMRVHQIPVVEIAVIYSTDHSNISIMMGVLKDYCKVDIDYREKYNKFKEYCKKEILRIHQENKRKKTKITKEMVKSIQEKYKTGNSTIKALSEEYKIYKDTVSKIINNRYGERNKGKDTSR